MLICQKKIQKIESLPFLSTGDYETDARNNPNNIYIQRQLGLHYESISDWEGAKDIYLRQIKKHPTNPDAHFYLGHSMPCLVNMKKQDSLLKRHLS